MARRSQPHLDGRVVAITGGARGIGRATAQAFAAFGATVVIGDIDAELAEATAKALGANAFRVDVADDDSFTTFVDRIEREVGPLHVLVNNAGIMPLGPLQEEAEAVTRRILEINLLGAIHGTRLAMTRMVPRMAGAIVNVSSAVGRFAVPHAATYSASKFGVVGLTQAVREELRGSGVQASVVLPAITATELVDGLPESKLQPTIQPEDVAAEIVAVVSSGEFEVWVPRGRQRQFKLMSMLPQSWVAYTARATGGTGILASADPVARAAYENRARGS